MKYVLSIKKSNFNAKMGQDFHTSLNGQGWGRCPPTPLLRSAWSLKRLIFYAMTSLTYVSKLNLPCKKGSV